MKAEQALPAHTKLHYWECYAKQVLVFLDAQKYCDLVYSDKPDLYDASQNLGVEVTLAIGELEQNSNTAFEPVLAAHERKLKKLNSGNYRLFEENELFIRTNLIADKSMREAALSAMQNASRNFKHTFSKVIVEVPFCIYVFDLASYMIAAYSFPKEARTDCEEAAKQEVLAAEKDS